MSDPTPFDRAPLGDGDDEPRRHDHVEPGFVPPAVDPADLESDGQGRRRAPGPAHRRAHGNRRGAWGGRGLSTTVLAVAVAAVLVLGAAGVWVQRQINPAGSPGAPRAVVVAEGSSSSAIGDQLASEGVIASALVWDWYLRINGGGPFQAGEYQLRDHSSMGDVVETLELGPRPPKERRYTMPEGLTLAETLARLADSDKGLGLDVGKMRQLLESGQVRSAYQPVEQPSNEGILFPETYRVMADGDEVTVLAQMVAELDATLAGLDVESAQDRYNLTPYEILIVASLIEEETKIPSERPMVARVIYNRLRQGIPLGIDATSRYEAQLDGRDRGDIDFTSDSPYNTRRARGLPPTPIASPGRASLEAALRPADGPWTYYVLADDVGHHVFTDSDAEFLKAKKACREAGLGCG